MAAAVFGLIQTSEYFEHTNYVVYLVSRIWLKSPAHPLSNAPGFKRICQEMRKIWPWRFGISNLLIDCPCSVVPLTMQTAVNAKDDPHISIIQYPSLCATENSMV